MQFIVKERLMAALYALIWVNPRSNSAMCHTACLSPANRLTLLFFSVSLARVGEWGLLLFTLLLLHRGFASVE